MTAPDAPLSSAQPWPDPPNPTQGIRAVDGNRAALSVLAAQQLGTAFFAGLDVPIRGKLVHLGLNLPLGPALLLSVLLNVIILSVFFRPAVRALLSDTRWRTPPAWGVALGAFVLGFIASRAFLVAYVTLFPSAAEVIPPFLAQGSGVWVLLLAAGIVVPIMEEIAFRGLMMRGHERAAGFGVAAVASSFAFALAHGVPATIAGILPLAYVLARAAQHTGSLWTSVLIHAFNNLLAVGLGALLADKLGSSTIQGSGAMTSEAMKLPLAIGAALFGAVVLWVLHAWLTPKADPQERSAPGPWLSAAWVVIVTFGLAMALLTLPGVQAELPRLQQILN